MSSFEFSLLGRCRYLLLYVSCFINYSKSIKVTDKLVFFTTKSQFYVQFPCSSSAFSAIMPTHLKVTDMHINEGFVGAGSDFFILHRQWLYTRKQYVHNKRERMQSPNYDFDLICILMQRCAGLHSEANTSSDYPSEYRSKIKAPTDSKDYILI